MKTRNIQRNVVSGQRTEKGSGLGPVVRVRKENVGGVLKRRKRGTGINSGRKRGILIVSIVLGAATCAVIALAFIFWISPMLKRSSRPPDVAQEQARVRVISEFASPSEAQALQLVRQALAVRDEEEVGSLFRLGSSSAGEVITFLKDLETREGPIINSTWLSSMDSGGLLLEGVLVRYQGQEKPSERIAFLTPDADGRWMLDFEGFARLGSPAWDDVLEGRAENAMVRVLIGRDVYYNGPFSDDREWTCYGLASPDVDEIFRAYCKTGSPQAEAVSRLFSQGEKVSRATLEIRRVKGAEKRQFEITRLLAGEWVVE
jgi:hypothetical protein